MRNIIKTALFALCLLSIGCGASGIVGRYKSLDIRKDGYYEFKSDGTFTLYSKGNRPGHGTYKIDETKSPKAIELIMDETDTPAKETGRTRSPGTTGIYKVEGNRLTIKVANGTDSRAGSASDFTGDPAYYIGKYERFSGSIPKEFQPEQLLSATETYKGQR